MMSTTWWALLGNTVFDRSFPATLGVYSMHESSYKFPFPCTGQSHLIFQEPCGRHLYLRR